MLSTPSPNGDTIRVRIRLVSGETIDVDGVDPAGSVGDLKSTFQTRHDVPVERQRILFLGREVDDHQTLASARILNDTIVHLVVRPVLPTTRPTSPSLMNEGARHGIAPVSFSMFLPSQQVRMPSEVLLRVRKAFHQSTRIRILAVIDALILWIVILSYDPTYLPVGLLAFIGYYGACNYNTTLLYMYQLFLIVVIGVLTYSFFMEIGSMWYTAIIGICGHISIIFQNQLLLHYIGVLAASNADGLALLRSVESTDEPVVTPRPFPTLVRSTQV